MTDTADDRTPTLAEVIAKGARAVRNEMHTCMPAQVISYDPKKQVADVQPSIKARRANGERYTLPVLVDVPVCHPQSGDFVMHLPLTKGQDVLLCFSERSIDELIEGAEAPTQPGDLRRFHVQDAFVVNGFSAFTRAMPASVASADVLTLATRSGSARFEVHKTGKILGASDDVRFGTDVGARALALAQETNSNFAKLALEYAKILAAWNAIATGGGGPLVVPSGISLLPFEPDSVATSKLKGE